LPVRESVLEELVVFNEALTLLHLGRLGRFRCLLLKLPLVFDALDATVLTALVLFGGVLLLIDVEVVLDR